jgi:hypothetical protein
MTLFEYVTVAISIIVALTIAEGLRGLQSTLDASRRYGVHVAWVFIKLANPVIYWWSTWRLRDLSEAWNMGTFTFALIIPSIMYLQLHSLVSDSPNQIHDWRKHFYKQRRWFFGLHILLIACVVLGFTNFYSPAPPDALPMIAYTAIGILALAGFMSDNARLHGFIAITAAVFNFIYWWILAFQLPSEA